MTDNYAIASLIKSLKHQRTVMDAAIAEAKELRHRAAAEDDAADVARVATLDLAAIVALGGIVPPDPPPPPLTDMSQIPHN